MFTKYSTWFSDFRCQKSARIFRAHSCTTAYLHCCHCAPVLGFNLSETAEWFVHLEESDRTVQLVLRHISNLRRLRNCCMRAFLAICLRISVLVNPKTLWCCCFSHFPLLFSKFDLSTSLVPVNVCRLPETLVTQIRKSKLSFSHSSSPDAIQPPLLLI